MSKQSTENKSADIKIDEELPAGIQGSQSWPLARVIYYYFTSVQRDDFRTQPEV